MSPYQRLPQSFKRKKEGRDGGMEGGKKEGKRKGEQKKEREKERRKMDESKAYLFIKGN